MTSQANANDDSAMSVSNAHQFAFDTLMEVPMKLSDYKGNVVLVVNTASQCVFSKQYKGLQKLHDLYADKGLVVIAVPSDDFGNQELETEEEVKEFTDKKFAIKFDITAITSIKGKDGHPFYKWAKDQAGFFGAPKWNFHKYLIDKEGNFVDWYSSNTVPTAPKIKKAIERELAK